MIWMTIATRTVCSPSASTIWSEDDDASIDAELEAAIEYKLATSGIAGVSRIFEIVRDAVRRRTS